MDHGEGSRVWDVDGNEYIDYILAGGPIILGHNHEGLKRSMMDVIGKRTWFHGFSDEMEIKAAEKIISHFPGIERVRFTSSGTEANAAAARIARSFTGQEESRQVHGRLPWLDRHVHDGHGDPRKRQVPLTGRSGKKSST